MKVLVVVACMLAVAAAQGGGFPTRKEIEDCMQKPQECKYNPGSGSGLPPLPEGTPSLPAGYPSLPDGYPSLPDGYPSLPDGYPSLPDGMPQPPQMPGGGSYPDVSAWIPGSNNKKPEQEATATKAT